MRSDMVPGAIFPDPPMRFGDQAGLFDPLANHVEGLFLRLGGYHR